MSRFEWQWFPSYKISTTLVSYGTWCGKEVFKRYLCIGPLQMRWFVSKDIINKLTEKEEVK